MMILITGGSKCGKSSVAEGLLNGFPGEKYYIAAMEPYGEDAQRAIAGTGKCAAARDSGRLNAPGTSGGSCFRTADFPAALCLSA